MAATPNPPETPAAMSPPERVAREHLAKGRFRKAREDFKQLCKIDRPKFLPLLIEANIGLAREMAGRGMVADAQQVLIYLKTIASPEQLLGLELELRAGSAAPSQGSVVADILRTLANPSLVGAERHRLADWAVLAFEAVPNPPAEAALAAQELGAILSALRAISERQFDQALELVRPLGQTSAFSHWKVFVKGLCAFYCEDSERASRFFEALPSGSVPGKASQSCLLLLKSPAASVNPPLPSEPAVEWAGRLAGEQGLGGALLRAEQAWRKANPMLMYQNLRGGIPRFPGEGPDLIGALSEFAFNCLFTLPFELQGKYEQMADKIVNGISSKNLVELQLFSRATVLLSAPFMPDGVVIDYWEQFLRTREKLHGPNPALDSLAYGWLGQLFSRPPPPGSPFFGFNRSRSAMRNAEEAQRFLEMAVNLDEENLTASLSLCEVYQERRQHSERNRLLDRMTRRFPDEKKVLMLAGQACLERKTYKRGLDYLERALSLDRLDPAIPDNLVKARLLQAREYFQKARPDEARKAMSQTAAFEVPTPANLARSRWCLKIQQGLIETTWGDPARGRTHLEEARRESPSEAAFHYYAGLADLEIRPGTARRSPYLDEFVRLKKAGASAAQAVALTRIWLHGKQWLDDRAANLPQAHLEAYLLAAAKRPFSREDGSRLVEFCLAETDFTVAGIALVENQLQEDAADPLFRLYRWLLHRWADEPRPNEDRFELEAILAEATRRKEEQTVRRVRQQLDALKIPPPLPANPFGDLPPADELDDMPDFGGGIPALDEIFGGPPPDGMPPLGEILDLLAGASEKEIKRLKQTRPRGMSAAEFDLFIELARAKQKSSNPGFPPDNLPPHPPRTIPPPDPNQSDLF